MANNALIFVCSFSDELDEDESFLCFIKFEMAQYNLIRGKLFLFYVLIGLNLHIS